MFDARKDTEATLRTKDWYRSATRWTQLTLAEDDPLKFDPDQWIDIFKQTKSNATCLSAGGYIAYYPSKVPFHYVSKFIGDSDPFGKLVDGARSLGMHVMARVDPHAVHQDAADAHPEWIAHDAEGNPRRHWAYPDVWVTCAYGSYNRDYMPEIVKEITRDYDIDAVFANRWQGHGVCYCPSCTKTFKAETGFDLPRSTDAMDPAWRAWAKWRRSVLTQMVVDWDNAVRQIKPHASFIPNMGGASLMEFDLSVIEQHCPFLVVDDQGRSGTEAIWKAGRNGKRMRATFRDRPVILIASVGPEDHRNRWKDSVTTGPEIEAWLSDGITHGMRPWFTKFNGVIPDDRWIAPVANAFDLHAQIEPVLQASAPATEIAVLDATTTLRHFDWTDRAAAEADELGIYHALIEAGLPFEFVSDHAMTPDLLDRFQLMILPNAVCLSDAQCRLLEDWVARGGSLIVLGASATQDENGTPRGDFGLAGTLGTHLVKGPRGPLKNTYVAFSEGSHPICQGFGHAKRIIGGTQLCEVSLDDGTGSPLLYVPDFPDLPMEEVYPRRDPQGAAVATRIHTSKGRSVHIPWNIGATIHDVFAQDHQRLIENTVLWALDHAPMLRITGKGVIDLAARQTERGVVAMMTNLTNPMMMKGPIREVWPVDNMKLAARLPVGATGAHAHLVLADKNLVAKVADGVAEFTIPKIETAEVAVITWG